jgi:hypothetical protein
MEWRRLWIERPLLLAFSAYAVKNVRLWRFFTGPCLPQLVTLSR